jgi:hypothetical protein
MNQWLNSKLLFAAALIGTLGLVGCGDDSPCASCAENLVAACERATEVCDKIPLPVSRFACKQTAQDACEGN